MQSINTAVSSTALPARPSVSDDFINCPPKRAPTSEMDGTGKLAYPDIAEISVLAGDFVLLAQTSIALIESDDKRAPDIDAKEAHDLAHLRRMKAETEQVLKSAASHVDLTEGAVEMMLVMLSIELSEIIDKLLKGRMQSQKDRNGQINAFTELQNALRKMEKSTDAFNAAALDKQDYVTPPGSQMKQGSIDRARIEFEKGLDAAYAWAQEFYQKMLDLCLRTSNFKRDYDNAQSQGYTELTVDSEGHFEFLDKSGYSREILPLSGMEYKLKRHYEKKQDAINKCTADFHARIGNAEKVSLNDMLIYYGVYKEGEKLPVTKEDLEAANEKISSMVNSINSVQGMKMLGIQKFTNGRNEAYDLAVKVNTTKFDSLNALIRMIGDR
ncbi:MAG TPA: hypothetical protein VGM52_03145 [Herbaspirillum sp.]|jgi:hypothetical protein